MSRINRRAPRRRLKGPLDFSLKLKGPPNTLCLRFILRCAASVTVAYRRPWYSNSFTPAAAPQSPPLHHINETPPRDDGNCETRSAIEGNARVDETAEELKKEGGGGENTRMDLRAIAEQQERVDRWSCCICFCEAMDPVVTLCGHLYCWSCIHEWLAVLSAEGREKRCPLCKKRVKSTGIIPIYSAGSNTRASSSREHPRSPRPAAAPSLSPGLRGSGLFDHLPVGASPQGLMMSWSSAGGGAGWVMDAHPFQEGFSMRSAESGGQSEERLLQEGTKEAVLKIFVCVLTVFICAMTMGWDE